MRLAVTLGILATRNTVDEVYHSRADFNKIYSLSVHLVLNCKLF
jgi:hypothetical protein